MEQSDYPYRPGEKGIDFNAFPLGRSEIITGSGRGMITETDPGLISVRDDNNELTAICQDGVLQFRLFTKNPQTGKRHPDLFAGHFTNLAITHFERTGQSISEIRSTWMADSVNFQQFLEQYERDGRTDKIAAALSTWSAQIYAKHGFTSIGEHDLHFIENEFDPKLSKVFVHFRRPTDVSK